MTTLRHFQITIDDHTLASPMQFIQSDDLKFTLLIHPAVGSAVLKMKG
jgi:hypothetical protein